MTKEIELLNYIFQNTQMGIISLKELVDLNDDKKFNKLLRKQLIHYKSFNEKTIILLNERGMYEKDISSLKKIKTYLIINMQTLIDKTTSHLSEMLILGSTMGVLDIIKKMKEYDEHDIYISNLIQELKEFEEDNIENLKQFV